MSLTGRRAGGDEAAQDLITDSNDLLAQVRAEVRALAPEPRAERAEAQTQQAETRVDAEHVHAAAGPHWPHSDEARFRALEARVLAAEAQAESERALKLQAERRTAEANELKLEAEQRAAEERALNEKERALKMQAERRTAEAHELKLEAEQRAAEERALNEKERMLKLQAERRAAESERREEQAQQRAREERRRAECMRKTVLRFEEMLAGTQQKPDEHLRSLTGPTEHRRPVSIPPRQRDLEVLRDREHGRDFIGTFVPSTSLHVHRALFQQFCVRGDVRSYGDARLWLTSLSEEPIDWGAFSEWEGYINMI